MVLAKFALVSRRWRPACIVHKKYEEYPLLMPAETIQQRMDTIKELVHKAYPKIWIDSYLFLIAIFFVIGAAVFSIALQQSSPEDKRNLWYPLMVLLVPASIAFWTSRRRSVYYRQIGQFHEHLQICLKELTVLDTARQIKYQSRRPRDDDLTEQLNVPGHWHITLIIEIVQIDPENINQHDDILPHYNSAVQDIVLDMAPIDSLPRHTSEQHYHQQMNSSQPCLSYPLPPEYDDSTRRTEAIELSATPTSPPRYNQ
ncbi:hypothetical protein BJ944DRAFT_18112 [Cunninghamella echinulata]|nr:hypothetical protein BJ944DRAFT_18112 [Cunninghamella echinulata]